MFNNLKSSQKMKILEKELAGDQRNKHEENSFTAWYNKFLSSDKHILEANLWYGKNFSKTPPKNSKDVLLLFPNSRIFCEDTRKIIDVTALENVIFDKDNWETITLPKGKFSLDKDKNIKNSLDYANYLIDKGKIKQDEKFGKSAKIKKAIVNAVKSKDKSINGKITSARKEISEIKKDAKLFLLQEYLFKNRKNKDQSKIACVYYNSKLFTEGMGSKFMIANSYWYGDATFVYNQDLQEHALLLFPPNTHLKENVNSKNLEKVALDKKNWLELTVDIDDLKKLDYEKKFQSLSYYIENIKKYIPAITDKKSNETAPSKAKRSLLTEVANKGKSIMNKIVSAPEMIREMRKDAKLFSLQKYLFKNSENQDACVYYNSKLFNEKTAIKPMITDSYWYGDATFVYNQTSPEYALLLFPTIKHLNKDINPKNLEKMAMDKKNWQELKVNPDSLRDLNYEKKFQSVSYYIDNVEKDIKTASSIEDTEEETNKSSGSVDTKLSSLQTRLFDKSKNVTRSKSGWQYKIGNENDKNIYFYVNKRFIDKYSMDKETSDVVKQSYYYGDTSTINNNDPQTTPILLLPSPEFENIRGNFRYSNTEDIKKDTFDETSWKEFSLKKSKFRQLYAGEKNVLKSFADFETIWKPYLNKSKSQIQREKFEQAIRDDIQKRGIQATEDDIKEAVNKAMKLNMSDEDKIAASEEEMLRNEDKSEFNESVRQKRKEKVRKFGKNAINKLIRKLKEKQKDNNVDPEERNFLYFNNGQKIFFNNNVSDYVWYADEGYKGAFKNDPTKPNGDYIPVEDKLSSLKHIVLVLRAKKRSKKASKEELEELKQNLLNPDNWNLEGSKFSNWPTPAALNNKASRINSLEDYVEMYKNGFKNK